MVAGVAVAFLLWQLPKVVRPWVEAAVQQRAAVRVRVGEVALGWSSIELHDLHVVGLQGRLRASAALVRLRGSWWALLKSRVQGVNDITVRTAKLQLRIDASAPADGLWRSLRRIPRGRAAGTKVSRALLFQLEALQLRVDDENGKLVAADVKRARFGGSEADAFLGELRLGGGHRGDEVYAPSLGLTLRRRPTGWSLRSASASYLMVHSDPAMQPRLPQRLRRAVGRWGGQVAADANPHSSTVSRPKRALPSPSSCAGVSCWVADAEVRIDRLDLRGKGGEALLQLHGITTQPLSSDRLRLSGVGKATSGGRVSWDVQIDPRKLSGSGEVRLERVPLAVLAATLPELPWHRPELGWLEGKLSLAIRSANEVEIDGRLQVQGLSLMSPRLAAQPVLLAPIDVSLLAVWQPVERRLEVDQVLAQIAGVQFSVAGTVDLAPDYRRFELLTALPTTQCQRALEAIPGSLWEPLRGLGLQGTLAASLRLGIDSRDFANTVLEISVRDGCRFVALPPLANVARFQQPFDHVVEEPDGSLFTMTTGPGTPHWTALAAVHPFLVHAVLAHEDAAYFRHRGFAPWAIRDALARNLAAGRYVQGASTITMQLVKNVFLHREKTLARKVQEVLLTWWLESSTSKAEMLQLYLNVIEFGPAVYGLGAATQHYFGCAPGQLSVAKAVFLATILPSPKAYDEQFRRGALSPSMRERMRGLLRHMHAESRIDAAALQDGLAEVNAFRFVTNAAGASACVAVGAAASLPWTQGAAPSSAQGVVAADP